MYGSCLAGMERELLSLLLERAVKGAGWRAHTVLGEGGMLTTYSSCSFFRLEADHTSSSQKGQIWGDDS